MKTALDFLIAAKRCEIQGLEQLAVTGELVSRISQLVHVLQKERGVSNIYLASHAQRFGAQRLQRIAECEAVEAAVRASLDRLETESGRLFDGVRLFSRIAYVLHALDALPGLRARIQALDISPEEATDALTELIGGLLAVVFEAADTAADPLISRALVAMFNFMQGKEFAGQERAVGAAGFAAGRFDASRQQRLLDLVEGQERCFQIFADFADPEPLALWRTAMGAPEVAELERFRRIVCTASAGSAFKPELSDQWFDCATRRIDAMKEIQDGLAVALLHLCERKLAEARADLQDQRKFCESLEQMAPRPPVAVFLDEEAEGGGGAEGQGPAKLETDGLGPRLGRSILDMVHAQAQRLQTMGDELNAARGALHERKVIERAKGLLMTSRGLTEDQAYRMLRQTAMDQKRRLVEVAEAALALEQLLPAGRPSRSDAASAPRGESRLKARPPAAETRRRAGQ